MEIENLNLQKQIDNIWEKIYPIGSIYMSVNPTSPQELFGGAWIEWGKGRVPVGVDVNEVSFDSVERTGGDISKTLNLNHTHLQTMIFNSKYISASGLHYTDGDTVPENYVATQPSSWAGVSENPVRGEKIPLGNVTFDVLQPYITCYMWKRVEPGYYLDYYGGDDLLHNEYFSTFDELKNFCSRKL